MRGQIEFLETGTDKNDVYLLIQSTRDYSSSETICIVKSLPARRIFAEHSEVKK